MYYNVEDTLRTAKKNIEIFCPVRRTSKPNTLLYENDAYQELDINTCVHAAAVLDGITAHDAAMRVRCVAVSRRAVLRA